MCTICYQNCYFTTDRQSSHLQMFSVMLLIMIDKLTIAIDSGASESCQLPNKTEADHKWNDASMAQSSTHWWCNAG